MACACPRCGARADRGSNTVAGVAGGAVGAMLYSAFGPLRCGACGPIARHEFPPAVRRQIARGSVVIVVVAVALLALAVTVLVVVKSK